MAMKFNIYGRFQVEVAWDNGGWVAYRSALGKRNRLEELAIPSDLGTDEIATYLDAVFHEYAQPGQRVEAVPP
jgi:hypothetical protein